MFGYLALLAFSSAVPCTAFEFPFGIQLPRVFESNATMEQHVYTLPQLPYSYDVSV
jgi:hypothetical protein